MSMMQNSPESNKCYSVTQIDQNQEENDKIQKLGKQKEDYYKVGQLAKRELQEYTA